MDQYQVTHKGSRLPVFVIPEKDNDGVVTGKAMAYFKLNNHFYRIKMLQPESSQELEILVNHVMFSETYVVIAEEEFKRVTA